MATLKELLAQQEALSKLIEDTRASAKAAAVEQARKLINDYILSVNDVFPGAKSAKGQKKGRSAVEAKYRDPMTGKTWSGRGLAPKWLQGKNKDDYLIK